MNLFTRFMPSGSVPLPEGGDIYRKIS